MPRLSKPVFDEVLDILLPRMHTVADREGELIPVLQENPVFEKIVWEGNAKTFVAHLAKLLSHSDLIEVLKNLSVGEDQRSRIESLCNLIEEENIRPPLAGPPRTDAPPAAGQEVHRSSETERESPSTDEQKQDMPDADAIPSRDPRTDQPANARDVWAELQDRLADDVFGISNWSRSETSAEGVLLGMSAVRHGLKRDTAKRFRDRDNLKMFVGLHEKFVEDCVERIPVQANKEEVERAFSAAVDRQWSRKHSKWKISAAFLIAMFALACFRCVWDLDAGLAVAIGLGGLAGAGVCAHLFFKK